MSKKIEFVVVDPAGMHIKPLTILVNEANRFDSRITLSYNKKSVNLKSIMGALSLGIPTKAAVCVLIEGADEEAALVGVTKVLKQEKLM